MNIYISIAFQTKRLIYNMSIDVFGRSLKKTAPLRGAPGVGFQITTDGQYDMQHRRLCNASDAINDTDLVTLKSVKKIINSEIENTYSKNKKNFEFKNFNDIENKIDNNHTLILKLMKYFSENFSADFEKINSGIVYQKK